MIPEQELAKIQRVPEITALRPVLGECAKLPGEKFATHRHIDHIGGSGAIKKRWPNCPLVAGFDTAPFRHEPRGTSLPVSACWAGYPPDTILADGDTFETAGFRLVARQILGHAWDHVVYVWSAGVPTYVFSGDVLFRGTVGRTDLPGGSFEQLRQGIHEKLFLLPDSTIVLPGHGEPTTIGEEKHSNPFVGMSAG